MADGDYERGRGRELAHLQARLREFARARRAASAPRVFTLNGWAASPRAWDLCTYPRRVPGVRLFSYVDQLDGRVAAAFAEDPEAKIVLVGWSMGGGTALGLARRFPQRLAGLVLLAATPRMMADPATGWVGMSEHRLNALRKGLELTHGEGFFGVPDGKPNPYMVDTPENLERGLGFLLASDVRADLVRVFTATPATFPVYIFQSARDGIVRPENAAFLQTVFPRAHVTMVPGAEHALPIQIPQEIDDAVDACLAVAAPREDPR